ncbi:MAG TPA: MBOAT family O-acyltransferase [Thermoanaerobaculia bacterium]|nr:MBOAT family O-acyltransferase [Thermoanaerobaculia bacterium]
MLFNSLKFLFLFLPVVYLVFWQLKTRDQRYVWLTLAGYVFYGSWNYKFCALMAFSTLVSYFAGLGMLRWQTPGRRRLCLVLPITVDLLLLGFFKYVNFGLATVATVAGWLAHPIAIHPLDIILPIGISFYTFHTISYIVDSYRRTITPTRNFFELACYVCLFPQLVAGPIVRFRQIESDLENLGQADRVHNLDRGWSFFAIGMMKKVLLADSLASIVNPALAGYAQLSTLNTWLCVLGYTYQLYFDFSGYSDMAVGLGLLFGLRLPQNFDSPYKSVDIADFWRRWHISLSTCLRDYLYIPLGGNRKGGGKTYRNLMITMLLGGLWHGASWTFVFWGGYHGALLSLNRLYADAWARVNGSVRRAVTFFAVVIGWLFFRATDFHMATVMLGHLFTYHPGPALPGTVGLLLALAVAAGVAHFAPNTFELEHTWRPAWSGAFALGYGLCLAIIAGGTASPFLYFQF